jgi:hypothetical protein
VRNEVVALLRSNIRLFIMMNAISAQSFNPWLPNLTTHLPTRNDKAAWGGGGGGGVNAKQKKKKKKKKKKN